MKTLVFLVSAILLWDPGHSESGTAPMVNVYSRDLGKWGQKNTLICHMSGISAPPDASIELLQNGVVILGSFQSDLAFDSDWNYYLTKHVAFTPEKGQRYACRVSHLGKETTYEWEPDE